MQYHRLLRRSGHLSYMRVRELMKQKLSSISLDEAKFGICCVVCVAKDEACSTGEIPMLMKLVGEGV